MILQAAVDGDHRPLDQVRRRPLNHRVDGRPFGEVALAAGMFPNPTDCPAAPEDRGGIPRLAASRQPRSRKSRIPGYPSK